MAGEESKAAKTTKGAGDAPLRVDAKAVQAAALASPEFACGLAISLASFGGPGAARAAGFAPAQCGRIAQELAAKGEAGAEQAGQLAAALSAESVEMSRAIAEGFQRAFEAGAGRAQWRPSDHQWGELLGKAPECAAQWMRSPSLGISSGSFWAAAARLKMPGDDAFVAAAKARCAKASPDDLDPYAPGHVSPPPLEAWRLASEPARQAMAEGLADAGSWRAILSLAGAVVHDRRRELGDRAWRDRHAPPGPIVAKRRAASDLAYASDADLALRAASVLARACPSAGLVDAVCAMASVDMERAAALARGALGAPIDLRGFPGSLRQPGGPDAPPGSKLDEPAAKWIDLDAVEKRAEFRDQASIARRSALGRMPKVELSLGELMARWSSEPGRRLAELAGALPTKRSLAVFARLDALGSVEERDPGKQAAYEALDLLASQPMAGSEAPKAIQRAL